MEAGGVVKFLRELLAASNPTSSWVHDPSRPLVLDLDSNSLSGVPLGSPFDRLEFLGPGRRSRQNREIWEFVSAGVVVEEEDTRIGSLFVVPIPDEYLAVEPYAGYVVIGGRTVSISWITREVDVIRAFGEPTSRDQDPEETVLFYEVDGRVEREIELTPDGRIKTIAIYAYL